MGQCVERAGGRASYPRPAEYAAGAKGALVAHFSQGRAVILFAGRGERPAPPSAQPVKTAVGGRVAYWWETAPSHSESAALDHCLTTAHSQMGDAGWEREAENWIRWARTPGHDAYWYYRDAFFDAIVPHGGGRALEVGCGEGRVARDLCTHGYRVTGLDASPTLVRAAREADPEGCYLVGDATELPFPDRTFDMVVAYNSLMDVHDMPSAVREASRVLKRDRCFCICVTHPINDAGRFCSSEPDASFVIEDAYLEERRKFEGTYQRDGLTMTFRGWSYSLEAYARALEAAGFVIECLREPAASERSVATFGRSEIRLQRIPLFLHIRARHHSA